MSTLVGFAFGFVSGWAARSTVESSRAAAVSLASTVTSWAERAKRAVAIEGDYLEDFVAEVRSRGEPRTWQEPAGASNTNASSASPGANGGVP